MIVCLGTTPTVQRTMIFHHLVTGEVNRAVEVIEGPSGKSVNVAKVLKVLGLDAIATGFLGGDRGQCLRRDLDAMNIRHDFVPTDARTRLCITLIDRGGDTHTELVEESPPVNAAAWDALQSKLRELLGQATMLALSGTLAPSGPPDFYGQCVRLANEAGIPAIVDAQGEALLKSLPARPALVKPNRAELGKTLGLKMDGPAAVRQGMNKLIDLGARAVVVTLGGEGAMACDGRKTWRIHPPKISAINSIGSGDSFTAGIIAALTAGQDLPEACRLGAACGAANALTLLSGEVRIDDVYRLLGDVKIEIVES
jgi:tagatose 6-phosphate kinase